MASLTSLAAGRRTLRPVFIRLCVFWTLFTHAPAWAQQYTISTIAGIPSPSPIQQGVITLDRFGSVYFGDSSYRVQKLSPGGVLTTVAGSGAQGFAGDHGPAVYALLGSVGGLAVDSAGNLFIGDGWNGRVRKVDPFGVITTVASGIHAFCGTICTMPLAVDTLGNVFIVDAFQGDSLSGVQPISRVLKLSSDGILTTVAGNGLPAFAGDGGPAAGAFLNFPTGLAADSSGNLYIADAGNCRVRHVGPDGIIRTVAGSGCGQSYIGEGGLAVNASISASDVALDGAGNLYIVADNRVLKVTPNGILTTVAGNGTFGDSGDGGPAVAAQLGGPRCVEAGSSGDLYISNYTLVLRYVSPGGIISTVFTGSIAPHLADGIPAVTATVYSPQGVAIDASGNLYIATYDPTGITSPYLGLVRRVSSSGVITTVAGGGTAYPGDGGPALNAKLRVQLSLAVDLLGNLYIADSFDSRVRKVSPAGIITTLAGVGAAGYTGDGGPAATSAISNPTGLAVDNAGNVYIADHNQRVRKVSPAGTISTVAGTGVAGYSGDGGPGVNAQLNLRSNGPGDLAIDSTGNLYIFDGGNNRIRKLSASGIITTVVSGLTAFDAVALAVDASGSLYTALGTRYAVRKLFPSGAFATIAGGRGMGYSGDGGPALQAQMQPSALAVDASGRVYVAERDNGVVRLLQPVTPPGCAFAFAPQSSSVVSGGANGLTFWATASASNCAWCIFPSAPWIKALPDSGVGNGTITYTVYPNFGASTRTGLLAVGNDTFPITQDGAAGTSDERFVRLLYFNFYGRVPSPSEVNFQVANGVIPQGRPQVAANFLNGAEFRQGGRFIAGLYTGLLDRIPDYDGWLFQRNAMARNLVDPYGLVNNFINSPEFQLKYGSLDDAAFVRLLYRQTLLRDPSQTEVDFQVSQGIAKYGRVQVALNFLNSPEFQLVVDPRMSAFLLHACLLERDPTPEEVNSTANTVAQYSDPAAPIPTFLLTPEFNALLQ